MLELEFLCFYNNAMDLTKNKFEKKYQKYKITVYKESKV